MPKRKKFCSVLLHLSHYTAASMAVALALVLTLLLRSPLEPTLASLFFVAIVVSSWHYGLGPGLLAIFLSALALDYFFIPPVYTFSSFAHWSNLVQLGVFLGAALMISSLAAAHKQAEVALRSAHDELERRVQQRTTELSKTNEALQTEVTNRKQVEQERNILYQLAHDLARASDVNTIASHLFVRAKSLLKADYGWLMLANANGTELIGAAAYGMDTAAFCQERIDLSREIAPAAVAFLQKQPVVVADVAQNPLVSERLRKAYHFVQSSCVAPLLKGEHVVGAFMVGYTSQREVTLEELRLLQLLSDEAALAVERARLADEVQRSEKRFRALIEQSTDAIALLAADSTLLYVSPSGSRMFGRSWEERIGRSVFELIHPEDLPSIKDRFAQLVREPDVTLSAQLRYQHQDGSWRWVEAVGQNLLAEPSVQAIVVNYRDITERKQAEEALRQSEERYRQLVELSPQGIFIQCEDKVVFVNGTLVQLLGAAHPAELIGKPVLAFVHPDSRRVMKECIQQLRKGQRTTKLLEEKFVRLDGTVIDVEIAGSFLTYRGKPATQVIVQDITERKRVEAMLAERARLATMGAAVGVALTQSDSLQAMLQRCAEAMVQHLNATLARIWILKQGQNVLELQASADLYTHLDGAHSRVPVGQFKIDLIAQERQPHLTNTVIGDPHVYDQEWAKRKRRVAFAGYPLLVEDRLVGVLAMFTRQPLTAFTLEALAAVADKVALGIERKQGEEALRKSEARFQLVTRATNDAVWEWNLLTNATWWNEGVHTLFGYPPEEVGVSFEWWINHLHPQDRERVISSIDVTLRSDRLTWTDEYRFRRVDGTYATVIGRAYVTRDDRGKPVRAVGAMMDITARKQMEEQLRDAATKLRALSRRLLEVQENERRALARELHDEVGQVLTGLRLTLEASLRLPPETARQRVEAGLTLVKELTNQVRQLSLDLRPAMLDDLGLAPALEWLCERYTTQTQVKIMFEQRGTIRRLLPAVETAAYRIVQEALTNIARHARVSKAVVRLEADQAQLAIEIQDQGQGFEPDIILTTRASSGLTGMRERAILLGGHLTVESALNTGTRVRATFPLSSPREASLLTGEEQ